MTITQYLRILDAATKESWAGPLTLHLDNGEVHDLYPASMMFEEAMVIFSPTVVQTLPSEPIKQPPVASGYMAIPVGSICIIEFK